jgi:hypothetical protein
MWMPGTSPGMTETFTRPLQGGCALRYAFAGFGQ